MAVLKLLLQITSDKGQSRAGKPSLVLHDGLACLATAQELIF